MSFVHHEPDLRRVPCLGCGERVGDGELDKHAPHRWMSCCLWHPYHYWCIRGDRRPLAPRDRCADCGGALAPDELAGARRWAETFPARVHGDVGAPPVGIRLVAWRRQSPDAYGPDLAAHVWAQFEIVHDACPDGSDPWRAQLRDAPADSALREVYADWLETRGELARAEFVRLVLRRRRATGDRIDFLDRQLRAVRQELPGGWCRDVARISSSGAWLGK